MKYLVHPKPYADESLKGYISRVALQNGYELDRWIYQNAGLVTGVKKDNMVNINKISPSKVSLKELSQLTGNTESELWKLTYNPELGDFDYNPKNKVILCSLRKSALHNTESKYCPNCLREGLYFRKLWELKIYNVCHIHNCLLISRCPKCNSSVKTQQVGSCSCGFNYMDSEPHSVSNEYSELERELNNKIYNKKISISSQNPLSDMELYLFVYLVIYFVKKLKGVHPDLNLDKKTINYKETTEAYKIFNDWPLNFYNFLESVRSRTKEKRNVFGLKEFGRLGRELLDDFINKDINLEFIVAEFERYLKNEWDGVFGSSSLRSLNKDKNWISMEAVIQQEIKSTYHTVNRLIKGGVINSKVIISSDKKKSTFIEKNSLEKYKSSLYQELLSLDVIEKLKITRKTLNKLIDAGLLKECNVSLTTNKDRFIEKNSLNTLLEQLISKAKPLEQTKNTENEILIGYKRTMKIIAQSKCSIDELLNGILNGELTTYIEENGLQEGLQSLYFSKEGIQNYLSNRGFYTINQLVKKLKLGTRTVVNWVRDGLLKAEKTKKDTLIYQSDLDLFFQTYITLDEIGKKLKMGPRNANKLLTKNGLKPVSGKTDGSSKYLYNRKEVEAFISTY